MRPLASHSLVQNMKTWVDFSLSRQEARALFLQGPHFLLLVGSQVRPEGRSGRPRAPRYLRAAACPCRSPGVCGATPRTRPPGSSYCDAKHCPVQAWAWRSEPPFPPQSRSAGPRSGQGNLCPHRQSTGTPGGGACRAPRRSRTSTGVETLTRPDHPRWLNPNWKWNPVKSRRLLPDWGRGRIPQCRGDPRTQRLGATPAGPWGWGSWPGFHGHKLHWLSELHFGGSCLRCKSSKLGSQMWNTLLLREKLAGSDFPPDCILWLQGWGLCRDFVSAFSNRLFIYFLSPYGFSVGFFLFTLCVGFTWLVSAFLFEGVVLCITVGPVCPGQEVRSGACYVMSEQEPSSLLSSFLSPLSPCHFCFSLCLWPSFSHSLVLLLKKKTILKYLQINRKV